MDTKQSAAGGWDDGEEIFLPEDVDVTVTEDADGGGEPEPTITIKYMGQDETLTLAEAIELAQKGRDYDRIRSRADALADVNARSHRDEIVFALTAEKLGLSPDELTRRVLSEKLSEEKKVPLEEAEAMVSDKLLAEEERARAAQAGVLTRDRDIARFIQEYGADFDPKQLGDEVWRLVADGYSLLDAARKAENDRLAGELLRLKSAAVNKTRASGSLAFPEESGPEHGIYSDWYSA
ncbi:MAG: hypothetical protein LBO63_02570 [Oscillospiraceae bacterium]|jgi:hypothetical protein|nr:hypothetical protein [Oscillospiraceae bacterium]